MNLNGVFQEGIAILIEAVNSLVTCPGYFVDTPEKGYLTSTVLSICNFSLMKPLLRPIMILHILNFSFEVDKKGGSTKRQVPIGRLSSNIFVFILYRVVM